MIETSPLAALRQITSALRAQHKGFALVGGLAVTVRSEPRFTRDVDLCVATQDDAEVERLVYGLRNRGYHMEATVEHEQVGRVSTVRLRGPGGTLCDLLVASCGIEPEIVQRATSIEVTTGLTLPVATVEELIALKVLSYSTRRPQDAADLQRLVDYNPDFKVDVVMANLDLITQRGYHRDQDLRAKLAAAWEHET